MDSYTKQAENYAYYVWSQADKHLSPLCFWELVTEQLPSNGAEVVCLTAPVNGCIFMETYRVEGRLTRRRKKDINRSIYNLSQVIKKTSL